MSVADTAIIPMQDWLNLGNEARINHPSTLGGINWRWRLVPGQLTDELADEIADMTVTYGRC
jgi:4-alpha-glucanotransferase